MLEFCEFLLIIFIAFVAQKAINAFRCGSTTGSNNTSCHFLDIADDLPYADETNFIFPENSIFFIETSCSGGLGFRQACSVESAARANPNRQINILFAGPVKQNCLLVKPMSLLLKYNNVKAYRIHLDRVVTKTPVQSLVARGALRNSSFPIHHTSNILRYSILYKHGGIYLDLDVVVVKPFDWLPESKNFVGKESHLALGSAVIGFSKEGIGKEISYKTLSFLSAEYRPELWYHNSIHVLTNALQHTCSTRDIHLMFPANCHGFKIYNETFFYPIHYTAWRNYFRPYKNDMLDKAYSFHLWNKMSKEEKIPRRSLYGFLIYTYCPLINSINSGKHYDKR